MTVWLSTVDNPYNPLNNFKEWLLFDVNKGYNTCSYVDRIANVSNEMSDEERENEIERAIDRIIEIDPFNLYYKVSDSNQKINVIDPYGD